MPRPLLPERVAQPSHDLPDHGGVVARLLDRRDKRRARDRRKFCRVDPRKGGIGINGGRSPVSAVSSGAGYRLFAGSSVSSGLGRATRGKFRLGRVPRAASCSAARKPGKRQR